VIEAVCRRLGYTGLKPDHEKLVRSFVNSWDVLESLTTPTVESLNASEIAPESLCCWKIFIFPESTFLSDQNLRGRQSLQQNVLSHAIVTWLFTCCHILHSYKCYVTVFATSGNENGIGGSPD